MNARDLHPASWQRLQDWRPRLPHALLFAGARGIGKTDLARAFAAALLCEAPNEGFACGACAGCRWFGQGQHPDFRLLAPEALQPVLAGEEKKKSEKAEKEKSSRGGQEITIAQIRELDEFLAVGAHRNGARIILLHPAESLNRAAANAILKILEEPPAGVLFLLVSSEPMRLLPTLRSRCQTLAIPLPDTEKATRILAAAGLKEAENWLALAGGAPELARQLAEKTATEWLQALTEALACGRRLEVLTAAAGLEKSLKAVKGENPLPLLLECAQKWIVDLNLAAQGIPIRFYLRERDRITELARVAYLLPLARFYRQVTIWRRFAGHPLNLRLFLEQFFFGYRTLFAK
ncbi:MAG: DNA polymerase III subunit delta' [Zoogloeaceae bacterium]|nr:DNA polymerase III subunit delta' [Zoogloeaceae bacterium]